MKKLSIEEKAKAYDNIIEKANKMHSENCEACQACIEELIPELKESEDEKIREEIIATIHLYYGKPLEDEAKEMLAWLEKQKPIQNINKEDEEVRQYIIRIMKQKDINVPMVQKALAWLEKQSSQDNAEDVEEPDFFDDFRKSDIEVDSNEDGLIAETIRYKKEKQGEQKPADKVEPKFKVGDIIKPKCYNETHSIKAIGERYYILDVNIKIPFRDEDDWELVEQKPTWSEEDERMRKDIIRVFKGEISFTSEKENEKYTAWLKSLRNRITWKPSEEQIKAFEHFVRSISESGYTSPYENNIKLLYSLLNDLKKLI